MILHLITEALEKNILKDEVTLSKDEATALRGLHSYLPPLSEMHLCEDKQKVNISSGKVIGGDWY